MKENEINNEQNNDNKLENFGKSKNKNNNNIAFDDFENEEFEVRDNNNYQIISDENDFI